MGRQTTAGHSFASGGYILLLVVMVLDNSGASRPQRVYTASMLYHLRRPATRPPPTVLSILSAVGILHYRGCRGEEASTGDSGRHWQGVCVGGGDTLS